VTQLILPQTPDADATVSLTPASAPVTAEYPKHEERDSFAVLDALSDIVCVTTFDGTLRYLNRAGCDLLGYADAADAPIGCLFPAHTPAARELLLGEVVPIALRVGRATCDTALQTVDGRIFPARQTVLVTPAGAGLPLTLTIVIRDVSIERHAAARLAESQRLFEMIARSSPDLMYLYDPVDERIVWMNRCVHAFLGGAEHDARTLSRRDVYRLVHPDDRAQLRDSARRMASAYGDSDVLTSEVRMATPGGTWRWLNARASVFSRRETGAPLLLLGIATDITVRKKAERRILKQRDAAELANQIRAEFVERMAAEFRAGLHAILGRTTEVRHDRDRRLTARERAHLDETIAQATRLLETVSDIHEFSAIETGELEVEQVLVDVCDVVRDTVAAFAGHPALDALPIELDLPDAAAPLLTDPQRLRQALTYLLGEAIARTSSGWISISLRMSDDGATPLSIDLHDSGAGIDADQQPRLFAPFDAAGRTAPGSTGLGFACARALCEAIGGSLDLVYSEPDAGSTFQVGLPSASRAARLAGAFPVAPANCPTGNAD
jgi:PAS domain S-box-containing protein